MLQQLDKTQHCLNRDFSWLKYFIRENVFFFCVYYLSVNGFYLIVMNCENDSFDYYHSEGSTACSTPLNITRNYMDFPAFA